jgi:hypothetical protein
MAELYAKPYEVIDTGYNPQQTQQGGQDAEMQSYLESLPPEERQKAMERINAPLSGEELAVMAQSGQRMPTLEDFAEIEKYHKNQEVSFIDGLGKIAEGGEQVMTDLSNAFASFLSDPKDATSKMPATAVEAFAQGTRNFYGMLAQSGNPDSTLFRVKDFLNGSGTIEDRYNQYMEALKFTKESAELAEGKRTLVMDKDMINHEVTQAMAYIADPTLFIPFGKVASTGLRAVGLGEKLAMAGARSAAIKNGILGNTIKWGAGQPLEFMGGAVRNTIDYGLEKAGAAFEATTGISGKEFAQTARMSGVGFSASGIAGHAIPYASTISDAYLVGSSARGFGEALTLVGETMKNNQFGRGVRSWAAESLKQAEKNGVALSPHAKGLLKTLDAVDPLFAYGWNGLETAAEGALIGGGLGYLSGGEEGMYSGIGAGIALGAVGGTAGKVVADVTGGTNVARRAIQAKMTIEGQKVINAEKAMFFQAMQKAAEVRGKDVDLVNSIIIGIDEVAPNFEFHALTPEQFEIEAKRKGYDPKTGKFKETSALDVEFGGDRASKSKAMYVLRSVGGNFVGNRQGFLDALKKASAKDSANPKKPASNIPLNLRKYTDVAKTFEKLSKTQQEAVLKEIDGQANVAKELGGTTKLREFYDALTWSEAWTDSLVKKFESDREGARKDITEMLAQETDKKGKLTSKGRALTDKLRAEGFLDKEGKLLRERNLLQADLTFSQFEQNKGAVIGREADGKTHMYINLTRMGDETFPHELFHTIMRESPMKKHFTDSLVTKLLGTVDKDGNLVRPAEVNVGQVTKFFKKYIDLTHRNEDGTLDAQASEAKFREVQDALTEYQNAGANKKISDKARGLLENYSEEFGAYYFSHWLMGRNRNTLFFGGELKGIEGIVERTKDSFMDFWQSKISKSNPEFDFSQGLNASFDRSKGLGRIGAIDYYMRDMVRAASNANREAFRPDAMTLDNLKDFERSNGIRNLTSVDSNRRLNPREQVTQNIRLGKEAYKILSGLDKNLRTSKDVLDENGKQVITGRLSENELDALVKGGIVPRAWADKVNQGYAMLDGTISNIFSAGYLGKTEQTTDASYPRLTGKDVAFKNRKAVLTGIDTKIKADGTFYTLFHTLDLAVIEQEANRLWQNTDYRNLWNGDRASMEADFFRYISNASKASTDPKKLDSAALLERGDGLGGQRRDVLHQMGRMALQTGDAYKHQPIAVIPEGIRHSVTTFNIDGMTMPRVETGTRYDIDMGNAHKFIRENWQPDEMKQEKTPSGVLMTHESGFKFSNINGKTTAYTSAGRKIGTFDNIKSATNAAKVEYNKVYNNIDKAVRDSVTEQDKNATKFQPLDENERAEAIRLGDVFALQSMKDFVGNRTLLRQTREEHIYQRALEAIENPEQLLALAESVAGDHLKIKAEYDRLIADITKKDNDFEGEKNTWGQSYYKKLNELRDVKYGYPSSFEDWKFDQTNQGKWNPPERIVSTGIGMGDLNPDHTKYIREGFSRYEADAKAAWARLTADPEYIESQKDYNQKTAYFAQRVNELTAERDLIDEFKKKNKEALESPIVQKLTGVLDNYKPEDKPTIFAKLVEASAKMKDYSGLLEAMFADEYDSQIQTGKPFVAVTTHGTGNVELMMARLFAADKLGSHYNIPSSRMGSFSAGSQNTSTAYGGYAPKTDLSAFGISKLVSNHSDKGYQLVFDLHNKLRDSFGNRYDIFKEKANKAAEAYGEYEAYTKQNPHLADTLKLEELYDSWKAKLMLSGGGLSRDAFISSNVDSFLKHGSKHELAKQFAPAISEIAKYASENNLLQSFPIEKMQLRKVIRMDNPYVVVDPRSYEEHYISPHMKRAMEAGHDGIIFKRFADGGQPDNVYVVFKDYIKDNIKVIDTSFDDVQVPRGNDETGRVLKGGKELNLAFQPTDEAEGGRVYTDAQFKNEFIGKVAAENPELTEGLSIDVKEKTFNTGGSFPVDVKRFFLTITKNGELVGKFNSEVFKDKTAEVLNAEVESKFRRMGYGELIYSEMMERMRSIGRTSFEGNIVDSLARPQKIRTKLTGQEPDRQVWDERRQEYIWLSPNQETKWNYQEPTNRIRNKLDPNARYQPSEEDAYQGGRTYDFNSKQFKAGFLGLYAEQNPDRVKGISLQFMKRADGSHRIRLTDNSKKGESADIGHITANIDGDVATLSTHINEDFRGRKLAYVVYSEMAERLRAMGVTAVDGTIVNPDGVPIKVRERIIGDTRDLYSGRRINYVEGANRIRDKQEMVGSAGGIDVTNTLYKQARYQPSEEVVQKAKKAGYNTTVYYHGTPNKFTEFKADVSRTMTGREGSTAGYFFFTPYADEAKGIHGSAAESGTNVMEVFLRYKKPFNTGMGDSPRFSEADKIKIKEFFREKANYAGDRDYLMDVLDGYLKRRELGSAFKYLSRQNRAELLKSLGFDSLIDKGNHIVVFNPEQIKSAADFTYDDEGKQIPLSERFDKTKKDIRYQPSEAPLVDAVEMAEARRLGDLFKTKQMREFVGDRKVVPQTADEGFTDFINNFKQADINQDTALMMLDEMSKDMFGGLDRQTLRLKYNELIEKTLPAWFKKYPREKEYFERAKLNRGNDYAFSPEKHEVNLFTRLMSSEDANQFIGMYRELENPVAEKQRHSGFTRETAETFAKKIKEARKWVNNAMPSYNDFAGYLADNVPMREYYQHAVYSKKFRTGEPVVVVGVHGTYTSQGFLKDKKYKHDLRTKDLPLSEGEQRGAYFAASDATVLSSEYQGYDPKKLGYEISQDFRRPESDTPNIAKSAIRFDNPLVVDGQQTAVMKRTEKILGEAIAAGHDGVIYINQKDGGGLDVSFILPVETANKQQRMIGSTLEKTMAGDAYEPLPRGEGLTNRTANLQPAEYSEFKSEQSATGRILRNAKGYVIMLANNKFRVYNPAKAIIGVYGNEEEAKKRIYKEIPKR